MPAPTSLTSVGNVDLSRWDGMWAQLRSIDSQRPELLDTVIAGVLLLGAVTSAQLAPGVRPPDPTYFALVTVGALPYVWRRRAPFVVLVVASVPVLVIIGLGYTSAVIGAGLFLAAYTVAAWSGRRRTLLAGSYVALLVVAVVVVIPRTMTFGETATNVALFAGAVGLGHSTHVRRQNVLLLRERAELAERARHQEALRAVSDERLRIAQELHDVIGHSLGVIALQAGVGAHVIDQDPAEARASLLAIATTSRSALAEVRQILGALRDDDAPEGYLPQPGLRALDPLAEELARVGLHVDVHVEGERDGIPAALDLTAYRLVQEALTNVLKHAGAARAEVSVRYTPDAVELEIRDDGRGAPPSGDPRGNDSHSSDSHSSAPDSRAAPRGHVGMRERVAVWGGTLTAGPRPGGGYVVIARLPYQHRGDR